MAVNDPTTNFAWALPDVGGDTDVWDDDATDGLNTLLNEIDTDVQAEQDALDAVESDVSDLDTRVQSLESAQILPVYAQAVLSSAPGELTGSVAETLEWAAVLDSVSMFDAGEPTRLTIVDGSDGALSQDGRFNLGGLYKLKTRLKVDHSDGGGARSWLVEIVKNGATVIVSQRSPSLDGNVPLGGLENAISFTVEAMDEAAPGDYYEVRITPGTDTTVTVDSDAVFEAYRLPSPRFAVSHVLYSAGLDVHGNDSADYDRYSAVDASLPTGNGGGTWNAGQGKFSGGRLQVGQVSGSGGDFLRMQVLSTPVSGGWASVYVMPNSTGGTTNDHRPLEIYAGSDKQFEINVDTGGNLDVVDFDGSAIASGSQTFTGGVYAHVEVQWGLSDSGEGFIRVWVDGTLDVDVTGISLGSGEEWDSWQIRGAGVLSRDMRVDDLVIQDANGQRLGDGHRIYTVSPDADAGTNEWDPVTGTDHYAMVDDTDPDQSTTRLNSDTLGQREEFTFTLPSITGTIREVVVKALADTDEGNDEPIKLGLRIGGTEDIEEVAYIGPANIYAEFSYPIAGNPNGGLLTEANLSDAVILLESGENSAGNTAAAVTQVWLEIITTA